MQRSTIVIMTRHRFLISVRLRLTFFHLSWHLTTKEKVGVVDFLEGVFLGTSLVLEKGVENRLQLFLS